MNTSNIRWNRLPDMPDLGNSAMVIYNAQSGYYEPATSDMLRGFVIRSGEVYVQSGALLSGEMVYSDAIDASSMNGMTFYGATSGTSASSFAVYLQQSPDGANFYEDGTALVTFSGIDDRLNSAMNFDSVGASSVRLKIINTGPDAARIYSINSTTGWYWGAK